MVAKDLQRMLIAQGASEERDAILSIVRAHIPEPETEEATDSLYWAGCRLTAEMIEAAIEARA